jgi:DNA-binding MarR family transcriptional regulator
MQSLDQLWQDFLGQGGEPSATAFGVWLIREQPALGMPVLAEPDTGSAASVGESVPGAGDAATRAEPPKISFQPNGAPAGYEGMDVSVRAAIMVGRLDRFLHFLTKSSMKESGMTEDEFVVLATLLYLPRVSKTQLLKQCLIEIPTGSELLKRMKQSGLILEKRNPDDGRSSFISISAKGRQQLFGAFRSLGEVEDALSVLSKTEKDTLLQLLDKLDLHHSRRHEIRQVRELMHG